MLLSQLNSAKTSFRATTYETWDGFLLLVPCVHETVHTILIFFGREDWLIPHSFG